MLSSSGRGGANKKEATMSELRYPNESKEYRAARDALLKDEQELIAKVKAVAERRTNASPSLRKP
jgi:predicted dithiol-disulfide oxidoreductase (DUF899 family)